MVGIYPGVHLGDFIPKGYSLDFLTSASIGFAVHHLEQEQTILNLRVGGGERVGRLGMTQVIKYVFRAPVSSGTGTCPKSRYSLKEGGQENSL